MAIASMIMAIKSLSPERDEEVVKELLADSGLNKDDIDDAFEYNRKYDFVVNLIISVLFMFNLISIIFG